MQELTNIELIRILAFSQEYRPEYVKKVEAERIKRGIKKKAAKEKFEPEYRAYIKDYLNGFSVFTSQINIPRSELYTAKEIVAFLRIELKGKKARMKLFDVDGSKYW